MIENDDFSKEFILNNISVNEKELFINFDLIYLIFYNTNFHINNNSFDVHGRILFDDYLFGVSTPYIDFLFTTLNTNYGTLLSIKKRSTS